MSLRALAKDPGRDYKNGYTDVRCLENAGLIGWTKNDRIKVPWDIVEARLWLAAKPDMSRAGMRYFKKQRKLSPFPFLVRFILPTTSLPRRRQFFSVWKSFLDATRSRQNRVLRF